MGENAGFVSGYKEYVAGMLAGVATVIVGHPFDTVKVKLQKHNTEANGIKYKNGLHCTTRILKTEGVCLLNPLLIPLFTGVISSSKVIHGFDASCLEAPESNLQDLPGDTANAATEVASVVDEELGALMVLSYNFTGAFAGGVVSFILCPSELVKCRMQVQGADSFLQSTSRYSSPIDCALKTEKRRGIFRGGGATFLREFIGNAVFFSTYEYMSYYMHKPLRNASSDLTHVIDVGVGIFSGGLGGIACWSAVLPLDVAKTIIQTSTDKNHTRNPVQVLELIYRRSGIRGCYTGLGPTIVRAFPANAAAIVTWELAMKILGIKHD
ncbi:hypothetical protein SASPL_121360 [Salvia splendens]|uniref:Solute carrier family 25 (Mitochondrial carnitine/acylcarnitine transporter), member 20/29 n=1 Tax=Salvia splendens TaxID=180675 RepID=A0A8X8XWB6_SALSN|nr:hypothetical protein SASPL_121360 [Salvia splendens]